MSARAEGPRAAVLVPQLKPPAAPEIRERFHEAITRGLRALDGEVLSAAEVRLRLGASEELLGCGGAPACASRVATTLRVNRVASAEISIAGKDYSIKLRLLDANGRELVRADESCDICTLKEADEAAARAAGKLASAARLLPPEAPPPVERAEKPKPKPAPPRPPAPVIETTPAHTAASPVAVEGRGGFPYRPVAIASLVIGVVSLAAGIPLVVIDGNPTCGKPDPRHSCPEVYNTAPGGGALLAFGVAGVVASVPLFILDARARHRRTSRAGSSLELRLAPIAGGAVAQAGGRF